APYAPEIENHTLDATNEYVQEKWKDQYIGIQRANDVIREIPLVKDGSVTAADATELTAEAKFCRGVFEMELGKMFRNVPYVDETVTYSAGNYNVPNPGPIWDKIEADFTAAMTALPNTQSEVGRANKYAAEAMLAYAYMFDHKYTEAVTALTDLINNGMTSSGAKYALGPYENNFNASYNNGPEAVFQVQMTVNDGSGGYNGNPGLALAEAAGTYTSCCGFYQPSVTLANAFQTVNGLPILGYTGGIPNDNLTLLKNDHNYLTATGANAGAYTLNGGTGPAFVPTTQAVDPRLDWTVGRAGIPYLDWGLCGGELWSRGDVTPYNPIKNLFWHNAQATTADNFEGWATNQDIANNYNLVRFADIYLWRAEAEVELNQLDAAEADVNVIRNRMAQHPEYWVHTYVDNSDPSKGFTTTPAANYVINPYPAGYFTAQGQSVARNAVEVERQLETGMEGRRFFDLQRYDPLYGGHETAGFMAGIINAHKTQDIIWLGTNPVLAGGSFTAGKNELYPIPLNEINLESGQLKQNPGYN
ncbi:MAG TPA: RagB/SusD family nutrient uptake outer membrane protein, partial [Candidatus Saccharimonadales bacterium]